MNAINSRSGSSAAPLPAHKTRAAGERSRHAILHAAAELATIRGFNGLSIGDLAAHLGMSKSGLYAHFGSKDELELATIDTAVEIFTADVLEPAAAAPPGRARLLALVDRFLSHLERRVFPGGCFFAALAAELDTRPGPARDRIIEVQRDWLNLFGQCVREAQQAGEIDRRADPAQPLFEIQAMLVAANFSFVMFDDPRVLRQARQGVEHVLRRIAPPERKRSTRRR